jgi:hypothetical protein
MIASLRRLFAKAPIQEQGILAFDYLSADGRRSIVHLRRWNSDGEYLTGVNGAAARKQVYRLNRITRWHDASWKQIAGYKPSGAIAPGRLP